MTARLKARWVMLTLRERVLILVMLALLGVTIGWFGIARPTADALSRAKADHAVAVDRAGRIAALARALDRARGPAARLDGSLEQAVAASAAEAGFTLDTANAEGPDRMSIAIGAARPAALFAWLAALEARGIGVVTLTATPASGGTVAARATLAVAR